MIDSAPNKEKKKKLCMIDILHSKYTSEGISWYTNVLKALMRFLIMS